MIPPLDTSPSYYAHVSAPLGTVVVLTTPGWSFPVDGVAIVPGVVWVDDGWAGWLTWTEGWRVELWLPPADPEAPDRVRVEWWNLEGEVEW